MREPTQYQRAVLWALNLKDHVSAGIVNAEQYRALTKYRWDDGKWVVGEPESTTRTPPDLVNHPPHYTSHPSKVECITITQHMGFCLGNALKYIWRADLKGDAVEDLKKARWYIDREIARRGGELDGRQEEGAAQEG